MDINGTEWTFVRKVDTPEHIAELFGANETAHKSFKTVRDSATFTNKRLILSDSQGITGRKKEIYTIPYRSVIMWSTENAGTLDLSSEVQLWTRVGSFKIILQRGIDVREFDRLLSEVSL